MRLTNFTSTKDGLEVRRAWLSDLELIVPLFDAYRQFYRQKPDQELARRFLSERLQQSESTILLGVSSKDTAVGFTQLFPSFSSVAAARTFILNDLFVATVARRKGVASLLLRAAADYGRAAGAVRLTLSTEVNNVAAQALYQAEGWRQQTDFFAYQLTLE